MSDKNVAPDLTAELASMTRIFHAACADLGAINEALGLDPDDGGSVPILEAIAELKAQIATPVAPTAEQTDHIAGERKMVAGEWQPIETAPKTGRTLLLGYPNILGKWRTTRGQWMSEAYIAEYWEEPDDAEAGWYETSVEAEDIPSCWPVTPTHWMPLPAAPASSTGDQEVGS